MRDDLRAFPADRLCDLVFHRLCVRMRELVCGRVRGLVRDREQDRERDFFNGRRLLIFKRKVSFRSISVHTKKKIGPASLIWQAERRETNVFNTCIVIKGRDGRHDSVKCDRVYLKRVVTTGELSATRRLGAWLEARLCQRESREAEAPPLP